MLKVKVCSREWGNSHKPEIVGYWFEPSRLHHILKDRMKVCKICKKPKKEIIGNQEVCNDCKPKNPSSGSSDYNQMAQDTMDAGMIAAVICGM